MRRDERALLTRGPQARVDLVGEARAGHGRDVADEALRDARRRERVGEVVPVQEDHVQVGVVGELAARELAHPEHREHRPARVGGALRGRERAPHAGLRETREELRDRVERREPAELQHAGEEHLVAPQKPQRVEEVLEAGFGIGQGDALELGRARSRAHRDAASASRAKSSGRCAR